MNAEKEIVNLWLNRQGFFTVIDTNAKNRVLDIIAVKQKAGGGEVFHIEVDCSVSSPRVSESAKKELLRKFNDKNVVQTVKAKILEYLGKTYPYEKILVTTRKITLPGVTVASFSKILHDVVSHLDTQNYRNDIVRALQLFKYTLLAEPALMAQLLTRGGTPLSAPGREELALGILGQESTRKLFRKQESEELLIDLLRQSTLKSPERLANALDSVMTKRTAARFLNLLLQQKTMGSAAKQIKKDQSLQKFFE